MPQAYVVGGSARPAAHTEAEARPLGASATRARAHPRYRDHPSTARPPLYIVTNPSVSRPPLRIATTCPSSDGLNLVIDKNAQQRARNPGKSGSCQGNVVTRALKPSELGHGPR